MIINRSSWHAKIYPGIKYDNLSLCKYFWGVVAAIVAIILIVCVALACALLTVHSTISGHRGSTLLHGNVDYRRGRYLGPLPRSSKKQQGRLVG